MKIYTKTGDKGMTGLYGGGRISKDSPRIMAFGDVDELNAIIGVARAHTTHEPIRKTLSEIQNSLFTLGAQLASASENPKLDRINSSHVDFLERQIDVISDTLPALKNFILPGGSPLSSFLHLARTICRRAERSIVHLRTLEPETVDQWVVIYLNRLSDFLFVLARLANSLEKIEDVPWSQSST